jgi:hypothetical protein
VFRSKEQQTVLNCSTILKVETLRKMKGKLQEKLLKLQAFQEPQFV